MSTDGVSSRITMSIIRNVPIHLEPCFTMRLGNALIDRYGRCYRRVRVIQHPSLKVEDGKSRAISSSYDTPTEHQSKSSNSLSKVRVSFDSYRDIVRRSYFGRVNLQSIPLGD